MSEIQCIALAKALALLKGSGAKYIVINSEGTEFTHGDLKLAPPEPERKRKQIVPMGTYKNVYEPVLKGMEVGQVSVIPCGELDGKALQSACTAWCSTNWGKGSALSHKTETGVEIMRLA